MGAAGDPAPPVADAAPAAGAPDPDAQAELRRLRWRCRRGMRELDQLMLRYLDGRWPAADEAERAVFLRLLATEDDMLWRWFMGRETPQDAPLAGIVDIVLGLPH